MSEGNRLPGTEFLERFGTLVKRGKTILDVGCGDGLPVDDFLVKRGFAINGIDVSPQKVELARQNVPEGFFEVKDMLDLREGEYCVDGVISLHAMLHIPRERYQALLSIFASFMSNGGAILAAMRSDNWGGAAEDVGPATVPKNHDEAKDNTALLENAGFTIIASDIDAAGNEKRQIILARY